MALKVQDAKIALGETTSEGVDLQGRVVSLLVVPKELTGTALTAQVLVRDGWVNLCGKDSTTAWELAVSAGRTADSAVPLDPAVFLGVNQIRFVSNAAQTTAAVDLLISAL